MTDVGAEVSLGLVRIGDFEDAAAKIKNSGDHKSFQANASPYSADAAAIMKRLEAELQVRSSH